MQVQFTVNINDRLVSFMKKAFTRRKLMVTLVVVCAASAGVYAASVPNTFSAGQVVSATAMNANFTALTTAVTSLEGKSWSGSTASNLYFTGGKVGIGTAVPGQTLDVLDGTAGGGGMRVQASGGPPYLVMQSPASTDHLFVFAEGTTTEWTVRRKSSSNSLIFTSEGGKDRLTLQGDGKVGIGTTSPGSAYALDVVGNIHGSADIAVESTVTAVIACIDTKGLHT